MAGGWSKQFIRIDGQFDPAITEKIKGYEDRLKNATPAFEALRQRYIARAQRRYARGFAPRKRPAPGRPMVRTGRSMAAITTAQDTVITPTSAEIGAKYRGRSDIWYIAPLRKKAKGRPKRDPVPPLTRKEREEWVAVIDRWILQGKVS